MVLFFRTFNVVHIYPYKVLSSINYIINLFVTSISLRILSYNLNRKRLIQFAGAHIQNDSELNPYMPLFVTVVFMRTK